MGLDKNEQLALFCQLPVGDASSDILTDIDDHISSATTGLLSKVFIVGVSISSKGRKL